MFCLYGITRNASSVFKCTSPHHTVLSHWNYVIQNIFSRPVAGEDYAADFASDQYEICFNPKNFPTTDVFALKILLRENPKKNINLAKKFFSESPDSPNDISDYDYQAKK